MVKVFMSNFMFDNDDFPSFAETASNESLISRLDVNLSDAAD